MSEYWVSKNKYWCKYCKVYIADDKPSRQHHESGLRHKGNLERYIRDIYKKGMQQEKDKVEAEREMRSIDAAAAAAMGISVQQASSLKPAAPTVRKSTASSSSGVDSYSTAESLGFVDPDAARLAALKELRDKEGLAGEWEVVQSTISGPRVPDAQEENDPPLASTSTTIHPDDPDKRRISFAYLKEKALPDTEDEDYASIEIKVKKRDEGVTMTAAERVLAKAKQQATTQAPEKSRIGVVNGANKFKPVQAREIEEEETEEELNQRNQAAWDLIAPRDDPSVQAESEAKVAEVPLFKKRKAGTGESSSSAKRRA